MTNSPSNSKGAKADASAPGRSPVVPVSSIRYMSPKVFAPFDGYPLVAALARDLNMKLLWCNAEYARSVNRTVESLQGTHINDVLPPAAAEERARLALEIYDKGVPGAYLQMWNDRRYLTAIWRLDPDAFGCEGIFVVMTRGAGERDETIEYESMKVTEIPHFDVLDKLSRRELEVLYYAAMGLTGEEMAKKLFRAPKTIENHLANITKKMGFKGRAELIRFAVTRGVITFAEHEWAKIAANRSLGTDAENNDAE